jgi:hypothetical protein
MKKIDRQTEIWAERHRLEGHHPYPAPTLENPERWECKCDPNASWIAVCRTLTFEQTRQKFAHLGRAAKTRREGRRLPEDDPAWQERIRQAKQRVAEHERLQGRNGGDDEC